MMRKWEIEQADGGFRVRNINTTDPQPWQYIKCSAIKSITGTDIADFGLRDGTTNQRKNPVRHDDKRSIIVSFHDENNSSPLRYNIEDVNNQPGWTNDTAGLLQALSDINSWCASAGAVISAILTGNVETPTTVQDIVPANPGTTTAGVKAFSIMFEGTGGSFGGVPVNSGYTTGKAASLSNTLDAEAYVVPNVADPAFPLSPRVIIEYVA